MNKLLTWFDDRFPVKKVAHEHALSYYSPKNFNVWYYFGSLAILVLFMQIVTGILLTMHYKPDTQLAFASVEYIMRDVPWGWLIRYLHSTGASLMFVIVYLHMFRSLMYGSFHRPRELLWIIGSIIFVALMAEAFMGYLLPWGNMSYWGAQVILSLFTAIPYVGDALAQWIRGDFVIGDATLNRFFAFHVVMVPMLLLLLVFLHMVALHKVGSNNPEGIEIKLHRDENGIPLDGIPFHPYYTVKDLVGIVLFTFVYLGIVFFIPDMGGWFLEPDNFQVANIFHTPPDIKPLWYFTPFYSILRAVTYPLFGVDAKVWGVLSMGLSILMIFLLPWLDRSPVKSILYKSPIFTWALGIFVVAFIMLGYLGGKNPSHTDLLFFTNLVWSQIGYFLYFSFFVLMPIYSKMGAAKTVGTRVQSK